MLLVYTVAASAKKTERFFLEAGRPVEQEYFVLNKRIILQRWKIGKGHKQMKTKELPKYFSEWRDYGRLSPFFTLTTAFITGKKRSIFIGKIIQFLVLFLFFPLFLQAVPEDFFFTTLNVESGLSQQTINAIFQDSDGYMWFATRNGLNRYDGYEITVFRKDYEDVHSLSGNDIQTISQDSARNLWVGTLEGINRIDYETGEIFRYPLQGDNYISAQCYTHGDRLYFFTRNAAWQYDRQGDTFRPVYFEGLEANTRIYAAIGDQNNLLYLGTTQGIFIYDPTHLRLLRQIKIDEKDPAALPVGAISYMMSDTSGLVWIVSSNNRVSIWDPSTRKLTRVEQLNEVRQLQEWNDTTMIVGTFYGLKFLNKKSLQVTAVPMKMGEEGALSHYSVLSLYKDRQDNLWVGTYSGGVNLHSKYNYRFRYIPIHEFTGILGMAAEDRNGIIWFATEGRGLLSYNPVTQEQRNWPIFSNRDSYARNIIKSILLEGDNILCATHNGQVFRFSIPDKTYHLLYDFQRNDIYALFRDSRGRLWIPTNAGNGLVVMDGKKEIRELNISKKISGLSPITVITELPEHQYLLGTLQDGLILVDESRHEVSRLDGRSFGFFPEDNIWVTAINRDPDGKIWVGTNGAGLFLFNDSLQLVRSYNKRDGLSNERIYSILNQGKYLWLVTSRELFRLDKKTGRLDPFTSKKGIVPQEFSAYAACAAKDTTCYLPASDGFLTFNPKYITDNQIAPVIWLTSLSINNQEVMPGPKSLLKRKLQLEDKLELPYNQTNLTIGYTALNYIYSEQTRYAYRLKGVDKNWNEVGNRRQAFYSNLKPGEYKFQVVASNDRGVWNNTGAELKIVVLPPLWFRWWALCIYTACMILAISAIIRARHRKRRLEASLLREQLEQKKLEEINAERLRFFTQVTHEFRTPLTLIINPLEDLSKKYFHISGIKEALQPIRKNAERLLSLVNSLMDLQKQDMGKEVLKYSTFDLIPFLREVECSFLPMTEKRQIHLEFKANEEILPVRYDREKLERLLFNLLSNACKFTPPSGTIRLSYQLLTTHEAREYGIKDSGENPGLPESWLLICVSDTGIGIPAEQAERIFDPFWHTGPDIHGKIAGSGIGLSITKLIATQHGGTVCARPNAPSGTQMCVVLPFHRLPVSELDTSCLIEEPADNTASTESAALTPEAPLPGSKRYKVLVVEDNPDILSYISQHLSTSYQVITAINGEDALHLAGKELPDMIVSDVMMPGMDGLGLCRRIKTDIRLCHILVVLLTARSLAIHVEEGFDAGADDYIIKPFRLSLLQSRIRNLFSNREQLKEIFSKKFSLESLGIKVTSMDEAFIDRYIQIVRNNFTNPQLDVDFICREMGMSRANFYKKLRTVTDLSPMDMIRNIRLESAAQLLKESHLTVAEIAVRVGFNSNSYFGTCFKALYGVSPKVYQASYGPQQEQKTEEAPEPGGPA